MGSHTGCEHGVCGACTVRVDGRIVRGCLVLAASLDGAQGRDHRGRLRLGRDPRPAGGVRRPQRLPVRLLHAGHAAHRRRSAQHQPAADARRDPRAPLRQLLPLHRLSRHRRCGRNGGQGSAAERPGHERDHRSAIRRPAQLLHRQVGAAAQCPQAGRGPRPVRRRHDAAAHGACRLRQEPARARQDPEDRRRRGARGPGRAARAHGRRPGAALRSVGGDPGAPQGHEVGAAAAPAARARDLGRRGGRRGGGGDPRDRRGCRRQGQGRLRAAAGGGRHGDGAGCLAAGDPPRARRQPVLPARQRDRQGRRRVQRRAQGRGGHLPHRPPHRA